MVDSADRERIGISKEELISMLEEDELKRAALVVLANKQDLPVRPPPPLSALGMTAVPKARG